MTAIISQKNILSTCFDIEPLLFLIELSLSPNKQFLILSLFAGKRKEKKSAFRGWKSGCGLEAGKVKINKSNMLYGILKK